MFCTFPFMSTAIMNANLYASVFVISIANFKKKFVAVKVKLETVGKRSKNASDKVIG